MIQIATQYPLQSLQLALLLAVVVATLATIYHVSRQPERQERARVLNERLIEAQGRARLNGLGEVEWYLPHGLGKNDAPVYLIDGCDVEVIE